MSYETIIYQPGPVARVILNRPERQNAQSWRMLAEMEQAFNEACSDPAVRIVILRGNGRSFSAGHDLDSPEQRKNQEERTRRLDGFGRSALLNDIYIESHLRWRNLPKPTVAMVHGYCIYGGWMIASAMDFIFAAADALFIPVYGDYFTAPWDVGARKAKELLYENNFIDAREALKWGFVNRVYPAAELEQETLAYAQRVAESDPFSLRMIKSTINQTLDMLGFTNSVRALSPQFLNRRAPQRPPENAQPSLGGAPLVAEGTFRNRVKMALEHLRQDRAKSGRS